ncbi:MAG: AtpZ/AtpI family protein [Acidimicrobiales bacterium]
MPNTGIKSYEGNVAVDNPHMGKDLGQSTGGYDLVLTGVVFALAGLWLDKRFGFTPVLTIVMTVVGFTGSVLNIYYRYNREIERLDAETAALRAAAIDGSKKNASNGRASNNALENGAGR